MHVRSPTAETAPPPTPRPGSRCRIRTVAHAVWVCAGAWTARRLLLHRRPCPACPPPRHAAAERHSPAPGGSHPATMGRIRIACGPCRALPAAHPRSSLTTSGRRRATTGETQQHINGRRGVSALKQGLSSPSHLDRVDIYDCGSTACDTTQSMYDWQILAGTSIYSGAAGSSSAPPGTAIAGATSHQRDCHFADALSPSLLKRLLQVEGSCAAE